MTEMTISGEYTDEEVALKQPLVGKKKRSTLLHVCSFIIANEFCERMAFYGFQGSLVLFFQRELLMSPAQADTQSALFSGACYMTPLIGGYLADSYLGRYKAIMGFISLYLVGMIGVSLTASPLINSSALFFTALYIVALGTGGIKPNVSTFGADQFDESEPQDKREKESFFNWFYWSINLGALVSFTIIAYICQNISFTIGYSIPSAAMALSIMAFWCGRGRYKKLPPGGSQMSRVFGIMCSASLACGRKVPAGGDWLMRVQEGHGGHYSKRDVDATRYIVRLLPFLALYIIYWTVYSQMSTTFINQGCQMQLNVSGFTIPVVSLNLFDSVIIILFVPLFDKIIYPWFKRIGRPLTMLKKMGAGLLLAVASMVVASLVERRRLAVVASGDVIEHPSWACASPQPPAANMTVFWQVPQYLLIGASEVLASITAMEFFYSQAPDSMRSTSQALNLVTTALGSWLVSALIPAVNYFTRGDPWIARNANKGHLDRYFLLLAALMLVDVVLFVGTAMRYKYKDPKTDADGCASPEPVLKARARSLSIEH